MTPYLWVAIGSALGGLMRFWLATEITSRLGPAFPWGTFTVNLCGSFVIGVAAAWSDVAAVRFFLISGFCGGFTTFSSYSLETVNLLEHGHVVRGLLYAMASVMVCVMGAALGWALGRQYRA